MSRLGSDGDPFPKSLSPSKYDACETSCIKMLRIEFSQEKGNKILDGILTKTFTYS